MTTTILPMNPPSAGRVAAPAAGTTPTKPGDWCGTPVPGKPRPNPSDPTFPGPHPNPFQRFRTDLASARGGAQSAADVLRFDPTMPVRPETPRAAALAHARTSLGHLGRALGQHAPEGALSAARQARTELNSGIDTLVRDWDGLVMFDQAQRAFRGAVNWMNVAENYVRFRDPTGPEPYLEG